MFTQPADLPEALLSDALSDGWGLRPASLSYQAVGFGSHHWLAVDEGGLKLFVTVDDLSQRLRDDADTTSAVFGRLGRAFESALSPWRDAGLDFVVAPLPAADGRVLRRLTGRYSLAVHPYLADCQSAQDGEFESDADVHAVLALLARLHRATAARPPADQLGTCWHGTPPIFVRFWPPSTSGPAGPAPKAAGWSSPTAGQTRATCRRHRPASPW